MALHSGPIKSEALDGSLDGYQIAAQSTAIYPGRGSFEGLVYSALKLNGEAGEVADKVGKIMRDDQSIMSEAQRWALVQECGDVLWYIAACAKELGYSLNMVAKINIDKLKSRQQRGTLPGSGDDR